MFFGTIPLAFPLGFSAHSLTHSPGQGLHPGLEGAVPDDDPREASADVSGRTCSKGGEGNYMRKLNKQYNDYRLYDD